MINLAAFKYRKFILGTDDAVTDLRIYKDDEERVFNAYAKLTNSLSDAVPVRFVIYGNSHGSGASTKQNTAVYKSISEVLERWAYYATKNNVQQIEKYGFDINNTSDGFSCYPELFACRVKKNAYFEALERWLLVEFNEGRLKMSSEQEYADFKYIYCPLYSRFSTCYFTIAYKQIDSKFWVYGFGVRSTLAQSLSQSLVELNRNRRVLSKFYDKNILSKIHETVRDSSVFYVERRLLFFSFAEGFRHFKSLMSNAIELDGSLGVNCPLPSISAKVEGPWSKYAIVWRTLIAGDYSRRMDHNLVQYFHF